MYLNIYVMYMVMKRIFEQVGANKNMCTSARSRSEFQFIKVPGAEVTHVLFADDTLLLANNKQSIEGLLTAVETISGICGMKLNKNKCVELSSGSTERKLLPLDDRMCAEKRM